MKVAVLHGGKSFERAVSMRSAARVEEALHELGHEPLMIDADARTARTLEQGRVDCAFIALHGKGGEDGSIQELLDLLAIPYTGSRAAASYRAHNKALAKRRLLDCGIDTPSFASITTTALQDFGAADVLGDIGDSLGFPIVVKPASGGSALGIRFAPDARSLPRALMTALSYDRHVVLERYIRGTELSVGILGSGDELTALPAVMISPRHSDYYDFESRYTHGETEFTCPADLPGVELEQVESAAVGAYRALALSGFGRVDIILGNDTEGSGARPFVLETNSIPGLTETSLLPIACEAAGITFAQLIAGLLDDAVSQQQATVPAPR